MLARACLRGRNGDEESLEQEANLNHRPLRVRAKAFLPLVLIALVATLALACGPVAQSGDDPAGIQAVAIQEVPNPTPAPIVAQREELPTEKPENTPTPTPRPTECIEWQDDTGTKTPHCYTVAEPTPTPKYPKLQGGDLQESALAHEEAERGSSDGVGTVQVVVRTLPGKMQDVVDWLEERDSRDIYAEDDHIYVYVWVSDLAALSELDGVNTVQPPVPLH